MWRGGECGDPSVCSVFGALCHCHVVSSVLSAPVPEGRKEDGGGEILIPKFGGGAKSQSRQFFLSSHAREGRIEGGKKGMLEAVSTAASAATPVTFNSAQRLVQEEPTTYEKGAEV